MHETRNLKVVVAMAVETARLGEVVYKGEVGTRRC
jgi:hypothetical protein